MDVKYEERMHAVLLKHIKCTNCSQVYYNTTPIYQCENGHNYCSYCHPLTETCSLCQAEITNTRNIVAQRLSQYVKHPCKFAGNGCEATFTRDSMPEHMKTCPCVIRCQLKKYLSPHCNRYDPCAWTGSEKELFEHVSEAHRGFGENCETVTHKFPIESRTDVRLLQFMSHQFWSYLYYDYKSYTMRGMVFCFGTKKEAKHFGFEYEVMRRDCPSAIVIRGDVVCMRGVNADLKEYFKAGKPSAVLFKGRDAFNQIFDQVGFTFKMTIVEKALVGL